jgi:5-methylthioadenosine/S-adenosylhomocysteine deaminase
MSAAFDLLVTGPVLVSGEAGAGVVGDAAIGITGGHFTFVGRRTGLPQDVTATERLDASGHLAIPGLINVHTHTILTMVRGVAEDMGFAPAYTPGVPQGHMVTEEEAVALARLGALEALLFGSTLINDSYVHAHLTLPAMAETGIRTFACARIHDVDFSGVSEGRWVHAAAIGEMTLAAAEMLAQRFGNAPDRRTGVQLAAHAPDTCSTDFLRQVKAASDRLGLPVTTHLSQSGTEVARIRERDGCTPAELLDGLGLLDDRLLAAHCIHVTESDIARIGRARANVAHIPKGNATGAVMAPTRALADAGARLCLATDNMHADMVEVMRWALVVGRLQRGRIEATWGPEEMLGLATRNGAAAMGLADELGSVSVGKRADLVLIDLRRPHLTPAMDPLGTVVHCGHGRDVAHVIVEGEIVVRDGVPTKVDMATICREGAAAAAALWARARA